MSEDQVVGKVFDTIGRLQDELVQTLSALVRIPSLVGEEGAAQAFMEKRFSELGLAVTTFEADPDEIKQHPAYIEIPHSYAGRPNVVGVMEGSDTHRSLILNGHVDVVSPEPLDRWTYDPWGGTVNDGKIYGRGVLDMKAGVIANLFAVKAILASGIKPRGKLICESVIEEEAGGSGGALACFIKGYTADGMLIPEPSHQNMWVSHNGVKYFRVKARGKTAHAALSHTGINVIGKMNKIYDALVELDEKRAAEHHYPLIEKASGRSCNLNMGTYQAGDWASNVAGMAAMECRIGFVPGETGKDVMAEVEKTVMDVARQDDWLREHPPEIEWYGWDTEPWQQDPEDPFVKAFLISSAAVLGKQPEVVGFSGGLDTRFAAYFDTPAFVFGPRGERFHGPDECVEIDSVLTVTRTIAKFILDWCGYQ
jgi:acetylornithine deacetylase